MRPESQPARWVVPDSVAVPVVPGTLIADRYKLLECLGTGAMGEVWKAQDTNFTRLVVVAVKLLKEDETFKDDQRNRENLSRYLQREASAGHLTFELIVNAMDEMFNANVEPDLLRKAAEQRFKGHDISTTAAISFFDELVNDCTFNENARHRRRLRDLFATEANSVAILQHPNIVRVTDYGEHCGVPFLVMDFINGRTLQQVIQRREPMPVTKRLKLIENLCEGLGYAHSKELIHRDIKPANLIIDSETNRLKVLDFGVVRTMQFIAQRSVSTDAPIGTYCYMSPEQTRASRTLDNRSDIFSCGLVFYELLSYQRAFPSAGDVNELIGRIQRDAPPPLQKLVPELDPQIEAIVYKAIEKVPAKRYADLPEMQRAIEQVRQRLEEEEPRQAAAGEGVTILQRAKPVAHQATDLVDRAYSAFETGDDHAVIEFTEQILLLVADQPDALELKERARDRIRTKLVEASISEARELLDRGEITSAGQILNRPEIDTKLPAVRKFTDDLSSARRGRRLTLLLREARGFFDNGALQEAIERAEAILEIDPANADARRIEEHARAALVEQHDRLDAALVEADKAAEEEVPDEAIRILTPFESDPAAAAKLADFRKELQEIEAHDRAVAALVAKARDLIAAERFTEALDVLAEGMTLDPENDGLLDVLNLFEENYLSIRQRLSTAEAARISALERQEERKRKEQERELERQRKEADAQTDQARDLAAVGRPPVPPPPTMPSPSQQLPVAASPRRKAEDELRAEEARRRQETTAEEQAEPRASAEFRKRGNSEVPGGRVDRLHLSVVAPSDVRPGEAFVLAVWAHLESQRQVVLQRALEASSRPVAIHTKGPTRVPHGTMLTVRVRLTGVIIDPTEDTILWEGESGAALFSARVPDGAVEHSCDGTAKVFANGRQIARIAFTIRVSMSHSTASSFLGRATPHRTAFASYAREDLEEVGARIQGMQKAIPDLDVFWDVLSLRAGQHWEHELTTVVPSRDVFFLFWSEAASRSPWVEREWRCALEARGLDYIDPVPLVSPEEVPPPSELAALHFGDRLLPFTARRSARTADTTYQILKTSVTRFFRLWSGSSNPK